MTTKMRRKRINNRMTTAAGAMIGALPRRRKTSPSSTITIPT